jgi:hypothetical protein
VLGGFLAVGVDEDVGVDRDHPRSIKSYRASRSGDIDRWWRGPFDHRHLQPKPLTPRWPWKQARAQSIFDEALQTDPVRAASAFAWRRRPSSSSMVVFTRKSVEHDHTYGKADRDRYAVVRSAVSSFAFRSFRPSASAS